jgi:GalNAc-alpha-(1->4)-GalNAc-alpha-(1->3)-diNAcBac-PP-undecaprenol alpha-1,4-N-acetyl-D-galactosaminyltransferase
MRLTLVISSLSSGGAERVMSILANYWSVKGWQITLLTFNDALTLPFYELDKRIKYIPLGITSQSPDKVTASWNNLRRIQLLRKAIYESKPDVVISFLDRTNIITLLATRGLKLPVIVSERNDPAMYPAGKIWIRMRQFIYPHASKIVVQSQRASNYFSDSIKSSICIIPNPVLVPPKVDESTKKTLHKYSLISIGRLESQKGFELLIKAFAKLKLNYSEWSLTILGDGSLRSELESLVKQLELTNQVHFLGRVKNPYDFLKQADIFVMSSRFEGFPNALCEAMASGLPVISTDCPSGPREIIRNGVDGILVANEDITALSKAIEHLMSNEDERKRLAAKAPEITQRFSLETVMRMWEEVIDEVSLYPLNPSKFQ